VSRFLGHWQGANRRRVDLKAHGTAPIVDLARLFALEAGRPETGTAARLHAAAEQGRAGAAAIGLLEAFDYLQELRLRHQAACQAVGAFQDDVIALSELTALQRQRLKNAMHLVHISQEHFRITYRTDLIA
jgi:CBS domain-containing protein